MMKRFVLFFFLIGILFVAFFIRVQGVSTLPENEFAEPDAYLYYAQAQTITKHGYLPARDMQRWLPLGRDNRQLLSLYAYVIAYTYKALCVIFPKIMLYQVQLYAPPLCFVFGMCVLFLFLNKTHGALFAFIVILLLATLPGSVDRSSAGYGDRDAWCWMLGTLAIITYLWKDQIPQGRQRYFRIFLSGFIVFLGGLSWEGFGFFGIIILSAELWKFCTTETENYLKEYLLWVLTFVPWLYLISPAYRSGYGFSTHVAALMLAPPLALLVLRCVRYVCLKYSNRMRAHSRKLAAGLTLLSIVIALGYFFHQTNTFATTAFPFKESKLMKSVDELIDPIFLSWVYRYGSIFVLGSMGLVVESIRLWKQKGVLLAIALTFFAATTFFRQPLDAWIGSEAGNRLFFITLVLVPIGISTACLRRKKTEGELITLIAIIWFFLWVGLARGGKRYDFFVGVPLALGTACFLCTLVLCQSLVDGYSLLSLMRASSIVKRHWTVARC